MRHRRNPRPQRVSTYSKALEELLKAAKHLAPDEGKAFRDVIAEVKRDGGGERETVKAVLYGLLDGMQYGNWPAA